MSTDYKAMLESTSNHQPTVSSPTCTALLCDDIKSGMLKVTSKEPIVNAGSSPLTLLWQIFEAASDYFEEWEKIEKLEDGSIEGKFKDMFPVFIERYPAVMVLDT